MEKRRRCTIAGITVHYCTNQQIDNLISFEKKEMLTPAPIDIRPLELELHCTQLSFLKCASKQSPRKCFFWLFVHMYILTRRLFASGLLAPSGALMFILVYYIHTQPLLQIFQILQILKYLKDPTCGIFLKSKGFKDIKYDIPVYQM